MSLEITYRLLAQSSRSEAIDVLQRGLQVGDQKTRRSCVETLANRTCRRSHEILVAAWNGHADDIRQVLSDRESPHFSESITQFVNEELRPERARENPSAIEDRMRWLTQIVVAFSIRTAMPAMVAAAWQHPSHVVRQLCVDAVLSISHVWGRQARRRYAGLPHDPSVERLRLELTSQLLVCVQNFQRHRSEELLDAFLILSSWNDPILRAALTNDDVVCTLVIRRLRSSTQQPVMELLAGFIRRRTIPERVLPLMLQRSDAMYRETLLQVITSEPSPTILANLNEYGLPDSLRGGVALLRTLGKDRDAAMAHAYSTAMRQDPETFLVLLEILDRHQGHDTERASVADAVSTSLVRCSVPSFEYWIHAVSSDRIDAISDGSGLSSGASLEAGSSLEDRAAEVCIRLMRLAGSQDERFAKLATHLLGELSIQNALPTFPTLDDTQRLRIGRLLMQVDSATLDVVRDGLRHAVMRRRLEAIEFSQTLGLVDMLIEPFAAIVRGDHQSARLAAVEALGTGVSESSADLLREVATSPLGSLRDAAHESLTRRGITN